MIDLMALHAFRSFVGLSNSADGPTQPTRDEQPWHLRLDDEETPSNPDEATSQADAYALPRRTHPVRKSA